MWSEEPGMTKVLFNIHTNLPKVCDLKNQARPRLCLTFTQVIKNINLSKIWSEELGMTKVLFNIHISNQHDTLDHK